MAVIKVNSNNRYVIDGKEYLRVSEVASNRPNPGLDAWRQRVGEEEASRIAEETSAFGTAVHKITYLNDTRKMKEVEVMLSDDPELIPFWVAWFDWTDNYIERWVEREKVVWSKKLRVAGRIDGVGVIKGDKKPSLIDIKTGNIYDNLGIALAGYKKIYNEGAKERVERTVVVHMPRKNPGYLRVKDYESGDYIGEFLREAKAMRKLLL